MPKTTLSLEERFWTYVDKTDACWLWTGGKSAGYGMLRMEGRKMRGAHRFSYETHMGTIPPGMVIDHMCRNRACVNPEHLRAVTPKQNSEHQARESPVGRSGIRGVFWHGKLNKWCTQVRHNGKLHIGGYFSNLDEAAADVIRLRNQLHTHNDLDRAPNQSAM